MGITAKSGTTMLFAALALLVACIAALSAAPGKTGDRTPSALVWPPPPEAPRVAYVRSIASPEDLGVKRSTFGKFARWLTGSQPESSGFLKPFGIALDQNDNLCFSDTGANLVCFYDRNRKLWRRWGQAGKIRFRSPVAVAKAGRTIYVADSALGSILLLDDEGKLLSQQREGLQRPTGLAIASNLLFVADSQLQAVKIFDLQARPRGQFGQRGAGPGEFNFPTHIHADARGQLYVTDSLNSRIQVFDLGGRFLRQVGSIGDTPGHFSRPKGAATDTYGHLYVVDANFDNIQLFDAQGNLLMDLGGAGTRPGEFWLPNGIAVSRDNLIYVADSYNHRIQVFKFIGQP